MEVTLIGTGNPLPQIERGGSSVHLKINNDHFLVDCGPKALYNLVEHGIDFTKINDIFFTHQHLDHNASFFHLAIMGWYFGRDSLSVFGPDGTLELINGLEKVYGKHISSWKNKSAFPPNDTKGLYDISYHSVDGGYEFSKNDTSIQSLPVKHHIETFAYKFKDLDSGESIVISGDTSKSDDLIEFTKGADVLIHECNSNTKDTLLSEDEVPEKYLNSPFYEYYQSKFEDNQQNVYRKYHTTPSEAADIANKSEVETLVLTHFNPYRDINSILEKTKKIFNGQVILGQDGLKVL